MPQVFRASRARIESFLDSIKNGRPIDNGRPWSLLDLLTLAGCAQCAVLSHGPACIARADLEALDAEKREAIEDTHEQEVVHTIRFLAHVAFDALDGRFGQQFKVKDDLQGVLFIDASGQPSVRITRDVVDNDRGGAK